MAVATTISPLGSPFASGKSITNDLPNSSTVTVKSVPRIAICAVGVLMLIFCLSICPILPVIKRAVPLANCIVIFDFEGFGSKITSSITSLLCSVSRTLLSSINVMPIRPLAVRTSSICLISCSKKAGRGSSLKTAPFPFSSVISPISACSGSTTIILNNTYITV